MPDESAAPGPRSDAEAGAEWPPLPGPRHPVDHHWLRRINRALVLACVREQGPIARVQIARRTGLSRTTVSAITHLLLDEGALRVGERLPASTQGGRRAVLLHAVPCRDASPETPAKGP